MNSRSIATPSTRHRAWLLPALIPLMAVAVPGPSVSQTVPVASAPSVSAGGLHSCGLTAEGSWDAGRNRWTGTLRWWNGGLYPGMTLDPATPGCEFPQLTITSPGLTAVMARAANDPS